MAAKVPSTLFLLVLNGPKDSIPCGIFPTESDALQWAARNPGVNPEDGKEELRDAANTSGGWAGEEETAKPFGYVLYKFDDGKVSNYAYVEPYDYYEPKEENDARTVDPDQDLNW